MAGTGAANSAASGEDAVKLGTERAQDGRERYRWAGLTLDAGEQTLSFVFDAMRMIQQEQLALMRKQDREPVGTDRAPHSAGAGRGQDPEQNTDTSNALLP